MGVADDTNALLALAHAGTITEEDAVLTLGALNVWRYHAGLRGSLFEPGGLDMARMSEVARLAGIEPPWGSDEVRER